MKKKTENFDRCSSFKKSLFKQKVFFLKEK